MILLRPDYLERGRGSNPSEPAMPSVPRQHDDHEQRLMAAAW
jgi:hypothetical protein